MAAKIFVVLSLVAAACALPVVQYEVEAPAHYEFAYSVADSHTGDVKQQQEARAGDAVTGSYSLVQPDGVRRVVHYSADKEHGFNAQVVYEGHPVAPAKVAYAAPKIAYAAPQISYAAPKIAYAAPQISYAAPKIAYSAPQISYAAPKIAYAAPQLAYAAPKLAYAAQPLAHVSFASPAISYQH